MPLERSAWLVLKCNLPRDCVRFWALQLGVERGGRSGDREGWAWVSGQGGQGDRVVEAYRLADFVRNTLRLEVRGCLVKPQYLYV